MTLVTQMTLALLQELLMELEANDAETIQLIKDTVRFMEETDDDIYADRCGDLLSGVYQIPSTPEEIGLIQDALDGSGTVPPPIELEDNGYGL